MLTLLRLSSISVSISCRLLARLDAPDLLLPLLLCRLPRPSLVRHPRHPHSSRLSSPSPSSTPRHSCAPSSRLPWILYAPTCSYSSRYQLFAFCLRPSPDRTVFFWAPLAKWGLVAAGIKDLQRPADKLSLTQNMALAATGFIWVSTGGGAVGSWREREGSREWKRSALLVRGSTSRRGKAVWGRWRGEAQKTARGREVAAQAIDDSNCLRRGVVSLEGHRDSWLLG